MFILTVVASALKAPKIAWRDLANFVERWLPRDVNPGDSSLVNPVESNGYTVAYINAKGATTTEQAKPLSYEAQVTRLPHWFSRDPAGGFLYVTLVDRFSDERSRFEYDANNDTANFSYSPASGQAEETQTTLILPESRYPKGLPYANEIHKNDPLWSRDRGIANRTLAHYFGCLMALNELKRKAYIAEVMAERSLFSQQPS